MSWALSCMRWVNGQGSPVGFKIAFDRNCNGKQLLSSCVQYIPSFEYSYTTTKQNTNMPVKVGGTSRPMFIYGVNYPFHVLKNDDAGRHMKPFVFWFRHSAAGRHQVGNNFTRAIRSDEAN